MLGKISSFSTKVSHGLPVAGAKLEKQAPLQMSRVEIAVSCNNKKGENSSVFCNTVGKIMKFVGSYCVKVDDLGEEGYQNSVFLVEGPKLKLNEIFSNLWEVMQKEKDSAVSVNLREPKGA